jgi:Ca2+-binding EF-hand superfamily protein
MKKIYATSTAAALAAVLTLAVSGVGWAEGMDQGMNEMSQGKTLTKEGQSAFSELDVNKDGKISEEEAKKNPDLAGKFDSVDSNHDKAVDEGEFARFETETEESK